MKSKTYKNSQLIFTEGDVNTGINLIQSGRVMLTKTKGSDLVEIDELTKGDFLGLSAFCDNKNENTTATAVGNVTLLEVSKEPLVSIKVNRKLNIILKMLQFLSAKLHAQNEKIKRLQYFNKLHYDKYQKNEISLYHLKDILRMSWILLLSFNRYNFAIKRDYFIDLCSILISDFKIRPEKIIDLYISTNVICEDKKTGNLSLIDVDKLEFFAHFLLQHFIKNPRRLLLNKSSCDLLNHMVSLKDNKQLFREDEFGFTHVYRHDLVKACETKENAGLIIERLGDKGFFKKEYNASGQTELSFEFFTIEEILQCYELINKFEM
jgi:hypothetical protein